jgi:hypothetical protein
MDEETLAEVRTATRRRRRPPRKPVCVEATIEGRGQLAEDIAVGPIELTLETTDKDGELAGWLDDDWWLTLLERWGDEDVTVHIARTPAALLHPVVLHQLEMLRRVVQSWRLIGHASVATITGDQDIRALAASPYDQVRFGGESSNNPLDSDRCRTRPPIEDLFARVRREQALLGVNRPTLVRLSSGQAPASSSSGSDSKPGVNAS